MKKPSERRAFPRFTLPGAKVFYTQETGIQGKKVVYGKGLMDDCSERAVRFETEQELQAGSKIKIELIFPAKETLVIKGTILRTSDSPLPYIKFAVVEFAPYGTGKDTNPGIIESSLKKSSEEYSSK